MNYYITARVQINEEARFQMRVCCVGKLNIDVFFQVRSVQLGENHVSREVSVSLGGKATNVAVALAKLGVEAHLVSLVGDDVFGDFALDMLEHFRKYGLVNHVERAIGERTGTTFVVLDGSGQNTMFNFLGANARLSSTHLERWIDVLSTADLVYAQSGLDGSIYEFLLSHCRSTFLELTERNGRAADFDYVSLNLEEAKRLTGEVALLDVARSLVREGLRVVFLKLGADGSAYLSSKGEIIRVKAPKIAPVDTTGAGDAFSACCIYGILKGWPVDRILAFANACGALTCLRVGTTVAFPTMAEVLAFLESTGIKPTEYFR